MECYMGLLLFKCLLFGILFIWIYSSSAHELSTVSVHANGLKRGFDVCVIILYSNISIRIIFPI